MERIVKIIFNISMILMLVGMFAFVGYMAYRQEQTGVEPEMPLPILIPWLTFTGVFIICIVFMCIFEIIYLCKKNGIKGIAIIGVIFAIILAIAIWFNKVLLETDGSLSQSMIYAFSILVTIIAMRAYNRIGKENSTR